MCIIDIENRVLVRYIIRHIYYVSRVFSCKVGCTLEEKNELCITREGRAKRGSLDLPYSREDHGGLGGNRTRPVVQLGSSEDNLE